MLRGWKDQIRYRLGTQSQLSRPTRWMGWAFDETSMAWFMEQVYTRNIARSTNYPLSSARQQAL